MSDKKTWNKINFIIMNGAIGVGFMVWLLSMAVDVEILPGKLQSVIAFTSLAILLVLGAALTAFRCRNDNAKAEYADTIKKQTQQGLMRSMLYALVAGAVVVGFTMLLNHFNNPFHRLITMQLSIFGLSVAALMLVNQYWMRFTYRNFYTEPAAMKVSVDG
jgi:hypothetical protein